MLRDLCINDRLTPGAIFCRRFAAIEARNFKMRVGGERVRLNLPLV